MLRPLLPAMPLSKVEMFPRRNASGQLIPGRGITVYIKFKVPLFLARLSNHLRVQGLDQSLDLKELAPGTPQGTELTGSQVQAEWNKEWKPKRRRLGPDSRTLTAFDPPPTLAAGSSSRFSHLKIFTLNLIYTVGRELVARGAEPFQPLEGHLFPVSSESPGAL